MDGTPTLSQKADRYLGSGLEFPGGYGNLGLKFDQICLLFFLSVMNFTVERLS